MDMPTGLAAHDHAACIAEALSHAETVCARERLRLTPARRRALEILLEEHRALGAYEVLERLQAEGLGAQPPAAYRALDFLVAHGFAHRIEGRNAFIACAHPDARHVPAFLVCRACDAVGEVALPEARSLIARAAEESGFAPERITVEAEGLCPACRHAGADAAAAP